MQMCPLQKTNPVVNLNIRTFNVQEWWYCATSDSVILQNHLFTPLFRGNGLISLSS